MFFNNSDTTAVLLKIETFGYGAPAPKHVIVRFPVAVFPKEAVVSSIISDLSMGVLHTGFEQGVYGLVSIKPDDNKGAPLVGMISDISIPGPKDYEAYQVMDRNQILELNKSIRNYIGNFMEDYSGPKTQAVRNRAVSFIEKLFPGLYLSENNSERHGGDAPKMDDTTMDLWMALELLRAFTVIYNDSKGDPKAFIEAMNANGGFPTDCFKSAAIADRVSACLVFYSSPDDAKLQPKIIKLESGAEIRLDPKWSQYLDDGDVPGDDTPAAPKP